MIAGCQIEYSSVKYFTSINNNGILGNMFGCVWRFLLNADYMKLQLSILIALFVTVLVSCGTTNNTSVSENAAFGAPDRIQTVFSNQYSKANYITWNRYN